MANPTIPNGQLTKKQKAALIVLSLDDDSATKLVKELSQEEIEDLTIEISRLNDVPPAVVEQVMSEYYELIAEKEGNVSGGFNEAKKLLERSIGTPEASEVMSGIATAAQGKGFQKLKSVDPQQIATALQKEHPQTIALVLSNLKAELAARILNLYPDELRADITLRMATLGKVSTAVISEIDKIIEGITAVETIHDTNSFGGTKSVASLLNNCDPAISKSILENIASKNPEIAGEIKRLMFVFEDLLGIDDRSIQRILREIDKKDLALSLKIVDDQLKDKIFTNMSERARDLLKEEIQYLGPVRLKEVEAAQMRIIDVVKQLEEQGELKIGGRGGKEEVFV